ncbi:MAG: excinuclease ABC subunit UvrA, partial [Alistipes sp.]|nr:excinuclease ABC subunit UvrA [Candidatus Minthomonas equi]
ILSRLEHHSQESDETFSRKALFSSEQICPVCGGKRLKKESLYFKLDGLDISQVSDMDISDLYEWVNTLPERLDEKQNRIAADIIKELRDRISFLTAVGLDYLTLNRATRTLSGGESQRIRLATQIGSKLVNVLYILDEPSIGLHQSDNIKLINSLKSLRDEGNSVMVVEHDEEMMRESDWVVDLGPGAGENGGELLFSGPPTLLEGIDTELPQSLKEAVFPENGKAPDSMTALYISHRREIEVPRVRRPGNGLFLKLKGACGNNLKNVDISIPLGCLVGVAGVSGSGKSSLILDTLMPVLSNKFYHSLFTPLPYREIEGIEGIDKLIEVDQSPIGRSPRSNPATYTNVFGDIRKLFESTPDAKIRGFDAGKFSFNVKGGRCEVCKGAGVEVIEMNFLPSVNVKCKECNGKRFKPDILAVKYKGKSISDVLDMTISQAVDFFSAIPSIYNKIKTLEEVGLGYVKLGQASNTLSGGENQRVKLATELSRRSTGRSLYLLDEPTTGLHSEDIRILMGVLHRLVNQGNTVIIIEHNLDVLKSVDYLFDMGPKGGSAGGMIVSQGTPEQVALDSRSVTGPFLKNVLN